MVMQIMTVSAFVAFLNDTFRAIWDKDEVAVEGEISGYRVSQGQWATFDLKDQEALVNVFMPVWKVQAPLADGQRVRVFGWPRVYAKYGKFSFGAERVELVGEGALRQALQALRQRLAAEGLFAPERKRVLPRFPQRIALIASRDSAAYGDFIRILNERWRGLDIDLYHVAVQGERAPLEIIQAIEQAVGSVEPYDVIVITRGGGSFEELMAFNDERVVRAIFGSKIPTLVGIGHERDLTLAEEAADVRASTPTDCARRLVPDREEVIFELATLQEQIADALHECLDAWSETIKAATDGANRWLEALRQKADFLLRLCQSFDPRAVVRRGYAMVHDAAGRVLTSWQGILAGTQVDVSLRDGQAKTLIQSIHYAKKENNA